MNKKELQKFIKARLENPDFEGCYYTYLGHDLYLVFSGDYNDNNDLDCKVAYNSDDLQCDYEWDWTMPENKYGDLISNDWCDLLETGWTAEKLTERVVDIYNYVLGCGWKLPEKNY